MSKTITEVHLLNVPLENDYKHTLFFEDLNEQYYYFRSKKKDIYSFENLSYQRKDNKIRIPMQYDSLLGEVNYVMYRNPYYSNKWFYAFITNMEYKHDNQTDIFIETDVIQTWLHDYQVQPSFIEREHVTQDRAGSHTVPEQLETGPYICAEKIVDNVIDQKGTCIVMGSTVDISESMDAQGKYPNCDGRMYGKIYSGTNYFAFEQNSDGSIDLELSILANVGQAEAVTTVFMAPTVFLNYNEDTHKVHSSKIDPIVWGAGGEIKKPTKLYAYSPVNQKLLTYPYCYLLVSNNAGSTAIYNYEDFLYDNIKFDIYGCITPGFSCRLIPQHYKNIASNNEEGLNLGKFPICNWNTDVYTNWLTQNSVNIKTSLTSNAVGGVASLLTLNGEGVTSGLTGIASTLGEVYSHSLQPPQSEGNINSGDVTFSSGNTHFTAYKMCIKSEYAKIIDDYFSMFGYKINEVKVPNKNHRMNYWFTKTIDANISGSLPMEDIKKIRDCYNRGITFWKNPSVIGDYSVSNIIMN